MDGWMDTSPPSVIQLLILFCLSISITLSGDSFTPAKLSENLPKTNFFWKALPAFPLGGAGVTSASRSRFWPMIAGHTSAKVSSLLTVTVSVCAAQKMPSERRAFPAGSWTGNDLTAVAQRAWGERSGRGESAALVLSS